MAFHNLPGALWDIQTNANFNCACYGNEFFNNAGVFRKSQGSGSSSIQVTFTNTGTVSALAGTIFVNRGGIISGSYDTAAGATINFSSGGFTMGSEPPLAVRDFVNSPAGLLLSPKVFRRISSWRARTSVLTSTFQNNGAITNLTLNGAVLVSTNTVTGTLTWTAGTLVGPLSIAQGGLLNISGNMGLQNVLTNSGTVTMTGSAALTFYNNQTSLLGGVYNLPGALWDIQTNANFNCACYGNEFFNNAGVFRKSQGSGSSSIQVTFTNTGTVSALAGTIFVNRGGIISGSYDTAAGATINFSSGGFTMGSEPAISGSGLCEFTGGTLTLTESVPPNFSTGGRQPRADVHFPE